MAHCCVPGCTNDARYKKNISFFTFPVEDKLRNEWIVKILRDEGRYFKVRIEFCVFIVTLE